MSLAPGVRVGPFEVVSRLGAGGMGEVYLARDARLGRDVALKTLPEAFTRDAKRRARLEREARMLASLNHPNVASLFGIEELDGTPVLVMEVVPGRTLAERLARGALPVPEALQMARQVAEGLEAAHRKGIIHRDLKPGNVKLSPEGRVKVLDFGLAKALGAAVAEDPPEAETVSREVTALGAVMGTAAYMSPEQARGEELDERTDVWSFGCLLYECLTGRRAFAGPTTSETLVAVLEHAPDWSVLPSSTPAIVKILLRLCLQKERARRLQSITDVRLQIEEAQAAPADVPELQQEARPKRARWRKAAPWALAAALGAVALALAIRRPAPTSRTMRFSAVTNVSGVEAHPSLSPDGRSVAYISNRGGQWDVYVGLVSGGSPVRITNDPNLEGRPRFSRDGSRLLFARLNEAGSFDVWEAPALGGAARRIVLNGIHPAWSPDGRQVAYSSGGALFLCDASGANPLAVTRPQAPAAHYQPAFSHDGRSLAFVQRFGTAPYGELAVVDLPSGAVRDLTGDGAQAMSPVWSPDDRFVYFASGRGGAINVWKVPAASGEPQQVTAGQGEDVDVDASADGTRLVFSTHRVDVNLSEMSLEPTSSGRVRRLTTDSARSEVAPRYSPDGRRIAYFSSRSGVEREGVWVMDADGGNPGRVVEDDRINNYPRWTPDGWHLLYSSRKSPFASEGWELRRVSLAGGPPQTLPIKGPWMGLWGDVAADGRILYRVARDAGEQYDPSTNRSQRVAELHGEPAWSPDGRSFAYATRPGGEPAAGLWIGTPDGPRRQVFHGWVTAFVWAGTGELLVVEGKPDLKGVLWRIDGDGRRRLVLSDLPLYPNRSTDAIIRFRFDVHPDGRRIAFETLEFEADIGMIEGVF